MFNGAGFAYPFVLLLLLVIPFILWYLKKKGEGRAAIQYSKAGEAAKFKDIRSRLSDLPKYLDIAALALLIIALARPQTELSEESVYAEGIDICVVLDVSGSMLAKDFEPNRLEAAKVITREFISGRDNDRIGLVIFAKEAFTQCPLTVDHNAVVSLLDEIQSGFLEDGTAIGNALASGVNRLKDSESKSKVIILLTDGVNNAGEIDPNSAAEIAGQFGVRVYTVGVGTMGEAPYDIPGPFGMQRQMVPVEIDEPLLQKIASGTGGKYFRATDNQKLESIYQEIDRLERTRIEVSSFKRKSEKFIFFASAGLIMLLLSRLLGFTWLRRLP
ncbi:MAG: VWA domain-containing protein [Ignavibacteria bacterium]|nr:VWA domain-containing protein [Ignavibacteria bacterium]